MIIQYALSDCNNLVMALATVHEIQAECGMTPDFIQLPDGVRVAYDRADYRRLERGELAADEYVNRHKLLSPIYLG